MKINALLLDIFLIVVTGMLAGMNLSKAGMNLSKTGKNPSKPGERHSNHVIMCFRVPNMFYELLLLIIATITFIYMCSFAQKLSNSSHLCHGAHKTYLGL